MKKILQIIPTLDRSGAEKQMVQLAVGLPKDRFEVHVCTLTREGPLTEELLAADIPIHSVHKTGKIDPWAYFRLKKIITEIKPDLVHTWLFAANAYGRKAAFACSVPVVLAGERCVDPWKSSLHFRIDKSLAKKTDGILTNSSGVRDFYAQNGLDPNQFTIIPNGVTLPDLVPTGPESKIAILEELGIPLLQKETPYLIGVVARLWPQKRLKDVIWACETLKFAGENFHCVIFGDGPERDRLLRYRAELDLDDRVHFPGHRDDVRKFIPHFDLLWNTSAYEGQSNSILEAMSYGIPVIASDIPGNRDLVVHEKTGILVPEMGTDFRRRRSMLIEQTLRLRSNPELTKQMGIAARERISQHFSMEKMIENHIVVYENLLNEKQPTY